MTVWSRSGRTPEVMEQGYREILQQVKSQAPRVRVHVESLLPCRDKYAKHNANVNDFNARLKKLAAEFRVPVVVEAIHTIQPGEELSYDYAISRDRSDPPDIDAVFACRCSAESCRGTMLKPAVRPRKPQVRRFGRRRS